MTVAAFMELALYDPETGYYARAAQRSGRAGDFFTSVDVGPLFGQLLEIQLAEMAQLLAPQIPEDESPPRHESQIPNPKSRSVFDLVEAGAGNGRLSSDILRAARERHPAFYDTIRLHLVEASERAREAQRPTLGAVADRLASTGADLPESFEGVLIANELLDALPVHQVVMRDDGLNEVYVGHRREPDGVERATLLEGPPSTPLLQAYLDRLGVTLEPGWRVEINLRAVDWIRDAARRLRRGFMILIDYGHEAGELYSATHAAGTLTTFSRHTAQAVCGPDPTDPAMLDAPWLNSPGEQDITAHVDFTSLRAAAEAEGMTTIGLLDQTYFLLGLVQNLENLANLANLANQLKTLILPGGLGSTHKVLILGKGVGRPSLRGCSFSVRVT